MPQYIRRREAGRDDYGHHWENPGDAVEVSDAQASQLLAEPALPMYSLVEPGATIEAGQHDRAVGEGDPNEADADSAAGRHERQTATGSRPNDPRLKTPRDEGQVLQGGSFTKEGKADTLDEPKGHAADKDASEARRDVKPDTETDEAPNAIDKVGGPEGRTVVGRSSRTK